VSPGPLDTVTVRPARLADLSALAVLFDAYRQFYAQPADLAGAERFLRDRLSRSDSQLWVAAHPGTGDLVGFCQCYPSFCSLTPGPLRILSDLFVQSSARRSGAGRALLRAAALDAQRQGCVRLELTTAHDNLRAQALYTSEGWQHDEVFRTYTLTLALALE
jgi:ribosomal protein S18 acetylase RimI-like enzyme